MRRENVLRFEGSRFKQQNLIDIMVLRAMGRGNLKKVFPTFLARSTSGCYKAAVSAELMGLKEHAQPGPHGDHAPDGKRTSCVGRERQKGMH